MGLLNFNIARHILFVLSNVCNMSIGFLLRLLIVPGKAFSFHNVFVMSPTHCTETPARYISISASSAEHLRRWSISITTVSNKTFKIVIYKSPIQLCRLSNIVLPPRGIGCDGLIVLRAKTYVYSIGFKECIIRYRDFLHPDPL